MEAVAIVEAVVVVMMIHQGSEEEPVQSEREIRFRGRR